MNLIFFLHSSRVTKGSVLRMLDICGICHFIKIKHFAEISHHWSLTSQLEEIHFHFIRIKALQQKASNLRNEIFNYSCCSGESQPFCWCWCTLKVLFGLSSRAPFCNVFFLLSHHHPFHSYKWMLFRYRWRAKTFYASTHNSIAIYAWLPFSFSLMKNIFFCNF